MEPRSRVGPSVFIQLRRRLWKKTGQESTQDDNELATEWLKTRKEMGYPKRIPNNRLNEAYTKTVERLTQN